MISCADHVVPAVELIAGSARADAKVYFNGFAAGASVNHLHYQYFCAGDAFGAAQFPIELLLGSKRLFSVSFGEMPETAVFVDENVGQYPLPHFVLSVGMSAGWKEKISEVAAGMVTCIYQEDCSVNLILADRGRKLYLIPRKRQEVILATQIGDGAIECAGVGSCYSKETFEGTSKEEYEAHISQYAVSVEKFAKIKVRIIPKLSASMAIVAVYV